MSDVKSKNLYELLGNTSDQDSDREPDAPTQAVDKPTARHGKRGAQDTTSAEPANSVATRGRGGNRSGGFTGNEAAFRDRATGRASNREQPAGDGDESTRGRGRGRGRTGPRRGGDRHSRTGVSDHQKQVGHGWGEQSGQGEWQDEKAGEAIATEEKKEAALDADKNETWTEDAPPATIPENGTGEAEPEPEDHSKSYADYLAEQAAKKLEGLGLKEARAPNEGSKDAKKWKSAKELVKEESDTYFKGEDKARRDRDRNRHNKQLLDIDYTFKEQPRDTRGGRGGRGRGRGGGERGDFRGRGRGRGGEFRGDSRGEYRGGGRGRGRGASGDGSTVAVNDESAFPSLGGR